MAAQSQCRELDDEVLEMVVRESSLEFMRAHRRRLMII